jgi:flagellar basal-body rod modification protein FlgD
MNISDIGKTQTTNTQNSTNALNKQLGGDDFMKLLVAELKNQDPLAPMQNDQLIAQEAQLNSLSQLQDLNKNISQLITLQTGGSATESMLFASSMLGKQVDATDPDSKQTYSGMVQSFQLKNNGVWFNVGGTDIPSSWIDKASLPGAEVK